MDKLNHYRKIILSILDRYEKIKLAHNEDLENQLILDQKNDRYQLIRVGFEDNVRIHYCVFHFDIKDGKIWVQHDATDIPVTQLLIDAGVPKSDIVLGFNAPYLREMMPEFAFA